MQVRKLGEEVVEEEGGYSFYFTFIYFFNDFLLLCSTRLFNILNHNAKFHLLFCS